MQRCRLGQERPWKGVYSYPGAVDKVVYASKFLFRAINHALYVLLLGHVNLEGHRAILRICCILLALLCRCFGCFFVYVGKDYPFDARFRE